MTPTPTITLTLTLDQTNAILTALAELPFRASADLIAEVRKQAQECLAAAEKPAELEAVK
jgi:hypothetical protein